MEQLTLDIDGIRTTMLTDRQTDRQTAADAGRQNPIFKRGFNAGGAVV